ncbi:hypothetical protein Pcinc_001396 [Petrolisthes cinctipes]|uniref:Uncharacterized protein n=1 Tax=Petrolisthes cinctipes TaxID=88211 RepID=A0AAE1GMV7_PETCI|nr:hypothetical protein Pcinc_001396 [Petrolisthes cinctipes]
MVGGAWGGYSGRGEINQPASQAPTTTTIVQHRRYTPSQQHLLNPLQYIQHHSHRRYTTSQQHLLTLTFATTTSLPLTYNLHYGILITSMLPPPLRPLHHSVLSTTPPSQPLRPLNHSALFTTPSSSPLSPLHHSTLSTTLRHHQGQALG